MASMTVSFTLPPLMKKELDVVASTGYYDNKSEFIRDAIRTLLAARRDVRSALACALYDREEISLGKASEIADVNIEEMKRMLHERGIARKVGGSAEEMERTAKEVMEQIGRKPI
ncbi:MAG: UPF0175 family protein [Candidatus Undinarchaeales archaeon]|jgi:predicted HTH domain antitoxin|nr:UPF0175 family protein [Candidatus Undinarchaeales archaeon]MDP7494403.1 UPF0175 family protein [Candidatus Undinarchaeales archaeon]